MVMKENPDEISRSTRNMPPYKRTAWLASTSSTTKPKVENLYWVMASGEDRMLYMEISPSK